MPSAHSGIRRRIFRGLLVFLNVVGVALLSITAWFLWIQSRWVQPNVSRIPREAFYHGTIGTEIMPKPVFDVLPELFPEHFQPRGPDHGDWIEQFGFLRSDERGTAGLPIGFTLSNYRAKSGAPSPVQFVGLTCALCHTSRFQLPGETGQQGILVAGPGNSSLNLFAWTDAIGASLLDEKLTIAVVEQKYRQRTKKSLSFSERMMIVVWLTGARQRLNANLEIFDEPFGKGKSLLPEFVPTGPSRTQPFRTLVRNVLKRPGTDMKVFTKLASVYSQEDQVWAQFDGSIRNLEARSSLAAFAAGATVENMRVPEIAYNIKRASDYTRKLDGPSLADMYPQVRKSLDPEMVEAGKAVYRDHCYSCHGRPGDIANTWKPGPRQNEIVPLKEIGTDPERVTFRHFEILPDRLFEMFPSHHPFSFDRSDIRPGSEGNVPGYVNTPLNSIATRAPYLHNGSVFTLADLINLKPRKVNGYRGRNKYDVDNVGLKVDDQLTEDSYFFFDTTKTGNSNSGHDYPWKYRGAGWNEKKLRHLLEYLKTI